MQPRRGVGDEVGSGDGNAQSHEVAVGDEDVTGMVWWTADRHNSETSAEQRMSGIGYLDLLGCLRRVLKGGIVLLSRSTLWIMPTCGNCSGEGYVTG
jgi:hypothetical protein